MSKIWKLGDDIDTDIIIPTQFMTMETIEDMKKYAFYPLRPELSALIKTGDVIVAGKNFGCGSSREQAPEIIKALGVKCVIAKSFARIFYRNALNNGLLVIENTEISEKFSEGDNITIDIKCQQLKINDKVYAIAVISEYLMKMLEHGGLLSYMRYLNGIKKGDLE